MEGTNEGSPGSHCSPLCFVMGNIYQVLVHLLVLLRVTPEEVLARDWTGLVCPRLRLAVVVHYQASRCTSVAGY